MNLQGRANSVKNPFHIWKVISATGLSYQYCIGTRREEKKNPRGLFQLEFDADGHLRGSGFFIDQGR